MSIRDGGLLPRAQAPPTRKRQRTKREKKDKQSHPIRDDVTGQMIGRSGITDRDINASDASVDIDEINIEDNKENPAEQMQSLTLEGTAEFEESADVDKVAEANALTNEQVDEAALEESEEVDLQNGREPKTWLRKAHVVADPFVVAKVSLHDHNHLRAV